MDEGEPAWRRELRSAASFLVRGLVTPDDLLNLAADHIKAAEEGGREVALREAAEKIRQDTLAHGSGPVHPSEPAHHWRQGRQEAADLIDPDKEQP